MAMNTNTANIYITASDKTKAAFSSITGGLKGIAGFATAAVAAIGGIALATESLKKYADLNDFENFNIGTSKALGYVDALKLAGMEQSLLTKSLSDLSTKMDGALDNKELLNTFQELGVSLDDIKKGDVSVVFDKILNSAAKTSDKIRDLANMKELFGKNGLQMFDGAQEGRIQRVIERIEKMKDEVKATSYGADELFKNFTEIKDMVMNDLANSFASVLPVVNALLTTIINTKDELGKAKTKIEIIDKADSFGKITGSLIDFVNLIYGGIKRSIDIFGMLWNSVLSGVQVFQTLAQALVGLVLVPIKGLVTSIGQLVDIAKNVAAGEFEKAKIDTSKLFSFDESNFGAVKKKFDDNLSDLANTSDAVIKKFNQAFSFEADVLIDKDKFFKNLNTELTKLAAAIDAPSSSGGGGTGGKPKIKVDFIANLDSFLKNQDKLLTMQKMGIDEINKYNELFYSNDLQSFDAYTKQKEDLLTQTYEKTKAVLDAQKLAIEMTPATDLKDRQKLEEKLLEVQIKMLENEKNYKYELTSTNMTAIKERLKLETELYQLKKDSFSTKEEGVQYKVDSGMLGYIDGNKQILDLRMKSKLVMEDEIKSLESKLAGATGNEKSRIENELEKAKNSYAKFSNEINPIAKEINDSITLSFGTFFSDVLDGTKSVKDAFKRYG